MKSLEADHWLILSTLSVILTIMNELPEHQKYYADFHFSNTKDSFKMLKAFSEVSVYYRHSRCIAATTNVLDVSLKCTKYR